MSTTTQQDTFNYDLILNLIRWAEQDERFIQQFIDWGIWDQGQWAWTTSPEEERTLVQGEVVWTLSPEERREMRNGVCKSAYCMAGQAVVQSGYRICYERGNGDLACHEGVEYEVISASSCVPIKPTGRTDDKGHPLYRDAGEPRLIDDVAVEALGITDYEAEDFFDGNNDVDDLKAFANGMCASRGLPPMFPDHRTRRSEENDYEYDEEDD